MAEKSTFFVPGEPWVGSSDVGVVGHHESIVSQVFNLVLNEWPFEILGNRWQKLRVQVSPVILLLHKFSHLRCHFFTDLHSFAIRKLGMEGAISDGGNELGSFSSFQNAWLGDFVLILIQNR